MLPMLHKLDGKAITDVDRQSAQRCVGQTQGLLELMLNNACTVHKLVRCCPLPCMCRLQQVATSMIQTYVEARSHRDCLNPCATVICMCDPSRPSMDSKGEHDDLRPHLLRFHADSLRAQEVCVWMGHVHNELQQQLWACGSRTGASTPPTCGSSASGLASLWDYRSSLSEADERAMKDALLREVARHYHTVRADAPSSKAAASVGWDDSFAAVMMSQQHNIAALMGAVQVRCQCTFERRLDQCTFACLCEYSGCCQVARLHYFADALRTCA